MLQPTDPIVEARIRSCANCPIVLVISPTAEWKHVARTCGVPAYLRSSLSVDAAAALPGDGRPLNRHAPEHPKTLLTDNASECPLGRWEPLLLEQYVPKPPTEEQIVQARLARYGYLDVEITRLANLLKTVAPEKASDELVAAVAGGLPAKVAEVIAAKAGLV